jgi:hypothetical protein
VSVWEQGGTRESLPSRRGTVKALNACRPVRCVGRSRAFRCLRHVSRALPVRCGSSSEGEPIDAVVVRQRVRCVARTSWRTGRGRSRSTRLARLWCRVRPAPGWAGHRQPDRRVDVDMPVQDRPLVERGRGGCRRFGTSASTSRRCPGSRRARPGWPPRAEHRRGGVAVDAAAHASPRLSAARTPTRAPNACGP